MTRDRGFTLIEMLVVVAIVTLISALAFPAIDKALDRQAFATHASRLQLAIVEARATAVREARPVTMTRLDFTDGLGRDRSRDDSLADARLDFPTDGLKFFADGTSNGGNVRLTEAGRTAMLSVSADTGAIRIAE